MKSGRARSLGSILVLATIAAGGWPKPARAGDEKDVHAGRAAPPAPPAPDCDLRRVDWANFTYPRYTLTKGQFTLPPEQGGGGTVDTPNILYADLNKNGKLEAWVPVGFGGGDWGGVDLWVFETDAQCRPQLVFQRQEVMGGSSGSIVGDRYLYSRATSASEDTQLLLEIRFAGGKFVESQGVVMPPTAMCDLHQVDFANGTMPGLGSFKKGQGSGSAANCNTGKALFADLDGDGALEAYVPVACALVPPQPPNQTHFFVFEVGPACALRYDRSLPGGVNAVGTIVGSSLVVDAQVPHPGETGAWSGVRRTTYRRANGAFTSTQQVIQ